MNQLLLPAPPTPNGSAASVRADPKIDLLSGDDFSSPKAENSLALVPTGEQQPASPISQQNSLVLFDMFSDSNNASNSINAHPTQPTNVAAQTGPPQSQQQQTLTSPQGGFYSNGSAPNMGSPQYEQSPYLQSTGPAWNGQVAQQQQPPSPVYGALDVSLLQFIFEKLSYFSQTLFSQILLFLANAMMNPIHCFLFVLWKNQ